MRGLHTARVPHSTSFAAYSVGDYSLAKCPLGASCFPGDEVPAADQLPEVDVESDEMDEICEMADKLDCMFEMMVSSW